MASHMPYASWDPERDGSWLCWWCGDGSDGKGEVVWRSWAEVHAEEQRMQDLSKAGKAGDKDAMKNYTAKIAAHAISHLG
eukprot:CAMPEP_0183372306 /NCGR_PEP_ID=MMETSP0164_2-20130417/108120_1 /TAXON_ID=221442 /ORGANISM="Coccolithus pelagicus ssp braarudi, Strain PLY182g" /LENGTH=79 /DNA_ID=CAMNT_0025548989 /DNA_START=72 /DNA_END=307 /DNA_ORIENTATION=-